MKKREMTTNDLEQLFNTIIDQKPLINEEQVNSLLYNLPKASSGNAIKQFIQNHLNTLIFGTIVLSSLLGKFQPQKRKTSSTKHQARK
jgi:hypothetical protein